MNRAGPATEARMIRRTALAAGLQAALAVAVTVGVLCGVAVLVLLRSQEADQNAMLTTTVQRTDDVTDPPAGVWLAIARSGRLDTSPGLPPAALDRSALAATAADGATRTSDISVPHGQYRTLTERRGDEVVQAVLDLHPAHVERGRLLKAQLVTGAIGLVLAAAAGTWSGRRAIVPLARALSLQRRFVADAGHELRTPLTLISTRAQLLQRHAANSPLKSEVDDLVTDAHQLTEILEDLLLAADPSQESPRRRIELTTIVRDAVSAARPAATEHGVRLDLADSPPVTVEGTEVALRRAVAALLDNGIRHAAGTLSVTVLPSGKHVTITVTDDGPGIDPAVMPTMFARFASGPPASESPGGRRRYGLGLALVSEIAARHGGTVSAHNATTGGAILRLTLPRVS
ncbi:sensor histidine kinase [Amycolatopsis pithecellobii]|uniref:histidine kinase n=1 Tax=Amycolatopsis pithecellobii TaxID=664692 RepID=A0A6N7YMQ3_9PSEU|nr:HAMP domain-containing sensor histidine kinase [Amycolatopsis pithecellobii]MTD53148.1 sensor histidine kinase [Amycolatopsis pithecellobii]